MGQTATDEQKAWVKRASKALFWEAIEVFEQGYAEVAKDFPLLPVKVGGDTWRLRMLRKVGDPLGKTGWSLPDLVKEAERRAYGYVRQGGTYSVSTSLCSPNSIRRLWAALQKLRPAPVPKEQESEPRNWLW